MWSRLKEIDSGRRNQLRLHGPEKVLRKDKEYEQDFNY